MRCKNATQARAHGSILPYDPQFRAKWHSILNVGIAREHVRFAERLPHIIEIYCSLRATFTARYDLSGIKYHATHTHTMLHTGREMIFRLALALIDVRAIVRRSEKFCDFDGGMIDGVERFPSNA